MLQLILLFKAYQLRFTYFFFFFLFAPELANSQQVEYKAFTTKDGLPSNHVYQCVEDNHGFLWVATGAGVARFDGKHFQIFTIEHGVPDNEVLQIVKEKNGTIWINSFKQSPAYFDDVKNRFINAREDSNLAKVSGTANMNMFVLDDGVMYHNENGSFVFRNRKLELSGVPFFVKRNNDTSLIACNRYWNDSLKAYKTWLIWYSNYKSIDSIPITHGDSRLVYLLNNNGRNYLFDATRKKCFILWDFQTNPLKYKIDSVPIPESFFSTSFTPDCFYVVSNSAKIHVFDKKTLQYKYELSGNYLPNNFYNDSKGNRWVSTIDKGLLVLRMKSIASVEMPLGFTNTNFISIALKKDGSVLSGNYYGEVVEASRNKFTIHKVVDKKPSRLRKILVAGNDVYTISDATDGIFINYTKQLLSRVNGYRPFGGKTGIICNDTLIVVGTTSGIIRVNTKNQKLSNLFRLKRATALARANDTEIYFGSTDGLYKLNYINNSFKSLAGNHSLLAERVTAICSTNDGLVWVSTSGNGIVVLQNDKVIQNITLTDGLIDNSARCLIATKNQVWLGTSKGISIIKYKLNNGELHFTIANLSVNDGLAGTEINEMAYNNDTVYAATSNGISIIPTNIVFIASTIRTQLIAININQSDTSISDNYRLAYWQNNIQMKFAGIELNGHFKSMQYTLDKDSAWTNLSNNALSLQLGSGDHHLRVRSIDVNGNVSSHILNIRFIIATPFWRALWFWLVVVFLLQIITAYLVSKWYKRHKEKKLAKQLALLETAALEQQAFTSLMNPHFIFNALNSIQYYINVQDRQSANRYLSDFASLIRKNFEASQNSFVPLEEELENAKIYLRLEQMRFKDKFVYEIVSDTAVDIEEWMIPATMIQPLLENSILHGLMPSTIPGKLQIHLSIHNNGLEISIIDNGIGITNSNILKQRSNHKSHGMQLIGKRISALSYFVSEPIGYTVTPVCVDEKNPGSKTVIRIPRDLFYSWQKAKK